MATEKKEKVTETAKETNKEVKKVEAKKEAPAKKEKAPKKEVIKADTSNKDIAKPTNRDFGVILNPVITEKSMALIQNSNQATFKVDPRANKTQIKIAFERIFKVKAVHVSVSSVRAKSTTRGGKYPGKIQGYKKAVITIKSGEAIDLFKE